MKKIVFLLLIAFSTSLIAQESVKLRYNYQKGDKYLMEVSLVQNMGLMGGMNMAMKMDVDIISVADGKTTMESRLKKTKMDMMQGGQNMSYDSDKKEEELDDFGKQMKAQMDPLMKAVTTSTFDSYGKMLETKVEPNVPGAEQAQQMTYTNFPEEAVKVGSTWTNEQDLQGMKMKMIYTVKEINASSVIADISGTVTTMGIEGKISGGTTINKATGNSDSLEINLEISTQGMTMTTISSIKMTKQ